MATARRRSQPAGAEVDDFLGTSNIIPGEVLLTLAPAAAADMTASVPTHPSGPVLGLVAELGVSDLDSVLADLGAHDITRLAAPGPDGVGARVLGLDAGAQDHVLARSFRVRIAADADVEEAVARLNKVGSVEVAEPNRYRFASAVPNDPRYPQQWGLPKINAPAAWDRTTGSPSVVVAVVDSGVDLTHPDLAALLVPGFDMVDLGTNPTPPAGFRFEGDFSGRDSSPDDEVGHGTHVAGTIASVSNNGVGVAGVTWQCRIMPVKALTRLVRISDGAVRGTGSSADVAAAIRWAADNGASVINMSLGSNGTTTVESSAVAYAIGKGCVVVAAMGNDGSANPSYPAAYPDVVSVGATDSADRKATFSQTGAHIDVVAPGVDIWSTVPGGGYGTKSGTSMATPHVAGVAALIRSVKPAASVAEVTDILRTTARNLRDAPTDPVPNNSYGWGLVDAAAAVEKASPRIIRTVVAICERPFPKTIIQVACQPIRTIRSVECFQVRTVNPICAPVRTIACVPTTILTTRLPVTVVQPGSYDPYGYFGVQAQSPYSDSSDVYGGYEQGAGEYEAGYAAGYEAGYLAALAELQGTSPGDDTAAAQAEGLVEEQGWPTLLPIACPPQTLPPQCPILTRIPQCLPPTLPPQCPPPTLPPRCLPPTNPVACPPPSRIVMCPPLTPRCPVTITRTPTWPTTIPVTWTRPPITTTLPPTTFPTTFQPGTIQTIQQPIAGDWQGTASDPYGQNPFQG